MLDRGNMDELFNKAVDLTHKLNSAKADDPIDAALGTIASTGMFESIMPVSKPKTKLSDKQVVKESPESVLESEEKSELSAIEKSTVHEGPTAAEEPKSESVADMPKEQPMQMHKGRITSSNSDAVIEGAQIYWCAEIESVLVREAAPVAESSSDGSFEISFREGYNTIRIVRDGYFDRQYSLSISADVVNEISLVEAPGTVQEKDVIALLKDFSGFGYNFPDGKYPSGYDLSFLGQGDIVQTEDERYSNGNMFTEALLVKAWLDRDASAGGFSWDINKHNYWTQVEEYENTPVIARDNRLDTVKPALDTGMANLLQKIPYRDESFGEDALPDPWTLFQGFLYSRKAKGWKKGHNFIIVEYHQQSDKLLILESDGNHSTTKGPFSAPDNGPRFAGFGHIDQCWIPQDAARPGPQWWKNPNVPTWQSIIDKYKYRVLVRLRINNLELTKVE